MIVSFLCLFQFSAYFWTWRLFSEAMKILICLSCFTVFDIVVHIHIFVKHYLLSVSANQTSSLRT